MVNSVGFVILWDNKILLSHPKKQADDTWGIAKGKVENNETYIQCALRETKEEIGLDLSINLENLEWNTIIYKNIRNKAYKKLHYTILNIKKLSDIGMTNEYIDTINLSVREIDEARFMTKDEALLKIFWRQKELLNLLN